MPGSQPETRTGQGIDAALLTSDGIVTRYYPPAPDLTPFVIDYTLHDSGPAGSRRRLNHYLPGPANVCLTFDAGLLRARIRHFQREWTSASMVFGPTSHGMAIESDGGRLVGFGITPLGWARLMMRSAATIANRIEPLAALMDPATDLALRTRIECAASDREIVATFDNFIRARLRPPTADDDLIARLTAAVIDPASEDVAGLAAAVGEAPETLRRIAKRHFGFPLKLLLRRSRFVRALMAMDRSDISAADFASIAPGYHDRSHFIRDAQLFLGMTGRQFLRDITPLMEAMRQGRRARFGQPLQGLIVPGRDNLVAGA